DRTGGRRPPGGAYRRRRCGRGGDLHVVPPVTVAPGAPAATGGSASDRRDQRRLPGLTARPSPPGTAGHPGTGARVVAGGRRWLQLATGRRTATAPAVGPAVTPSASRDRLRGGPSRLVGPGACLPTRPLYRDRRRARRRGAPCPGDRRASRVRAERRRGR